jgi:phosphoribosylanthranilate isomerase
VDDATDWENARTKAGSAEAYVLDAPSTNFGGSGRCFDWSLAAAFAYRKIVAGGLDATNVADAIRTAQPWGVDACSRLEASPGKKDSQRVRDFVNTALTARPQEIHL